MARPQKDGDGDKNTPKRGTSQEQVEMAQRIARELLRDDHRAFQVSVRNSRD